MTRFIQISTTCEQKQILEFLARELVEKRLAACVQINGPVHSTYRWQGQTETAEEWLCTIKTLAERQDLVVAFIKATHPYDEPEVIVTPITGGSETYLKWLEQQIEPEQVE